MDFEQRNRQLDEAVRSYGWLRILEALTPLEGAIFYHGTRNSKRFDICPISTCSEHQLWKGKGNFELFKDADETGGGYCYKCQKVHARFDILMEFNNWSFPEARKEVEHLIGFRFDPSYKPKERKVVPKGPKPPTKNELAEAKRNREKMNRIWKESYPLNHDVALPAARYFASRGITNLHSSMKDSVRFHRGLPYFIELTTSADDKCDEDRAEREALLSYCKNHPSFERFIEKDGEPVMAHMGNHPCLVILVTTPEGEARRLHREFLDENGGKASFAKDGYEVKRMMPGGYGLEITGCAAYIDEPSVVRGVGEGLETVLAVKEVTAMPMDCAINAGGLKHYVPPKGTKYIYIFEDKDASKTGENVAKEAEERLLDMGFGVIRMTPPLPLGNRKSVDWLDVLNEMGPEGFPLVAKIWQECLEED